MLSTIDDDAIVLADGLAFGAMPEEAEKEAARLRIVALVHHPLAAETGISAPAAAALEASERRALATARRVVVTSRGTAAALGRYGVGEDRIDVVEPGTDPAPLAPGSGGGVLHLLCVAALAPRKGHELLFQALASIPQRRWQLTCVGSLERHPGMAETLRTLARTLNLDAQIAFAGEATAVTLPAFYATADVFVLPTLYEGYGMAVAEALARGLPVVSTKTGAIAELVGGTAGIVVSPGDVPAPRTGVVQCAGRRPGRSAKAGGRRPPGARHAADMGRCREQDGRRAEPGAGLMGGFSATGSPFASRPMRARVPPR